MQEIYELPFFNSFAFPVKRAQKFSPTGPKHQENEDYEIQDDCYESFDGTQISYRVVIPLSMKKAEHDQRKEKHVIIFFHGNAELARDVQLRWATLKKFEPLMIGVDFRGYGWGEERAFPKLRLLCPDAESFSAYVLDGSLFKHHGLQLNIQSKYVHLYVVGRSLGSIPAIHMVSKLPDTVAGLVLDSPLADIRTLPLVRHLADGAFGGGYGEVMLSNLPDIFQNLDKLKALHVKRCLILHGSDDELIPLEHAQAMFEACNSLVQKSYIELQGFHHNDLSLSPEYHQAMRSLLANDEGWVKYVEMSPRTRNLCTCSIC